jgi:hypothetical protein
MVAAVFHAVEEGADPRCSAGLPSCTARPYPPSPPVPPAPPWHGPARRRLSRPVYLPQPPDRWYGTRSCVPLTPASSSPTPPCACYRPAGKTLARACSPWPPPLCSSGPGRWPPRPAARSGWPRWPILGVGGVAGAADAGPHPYRHHRPARGRPPRAPPGQPALVLVVLVVVEVGEQGVEVAVAQGPDRDARRLLSTRRPAAVRVRLGRGRVGPGHGWPPWLWLAGGPLRATPACRRPLAWGVGGGWIAAGAGG